MQLTCPTCGARYDVADGAIGPNGRRIRCRACDTSWFEPASVPAAEAPAVGAAPPPAEPDASSAAAPAGPPRRAEAGRARRRRFPWLVLALGTAVVALGAVAATVAFGPDQVAARLGLADRRVPLGIAITREPDWRLIAGGSQLFAISGRVWNPTAEEQRVPDIRAELRDRQGRTVYSWTIARPVARLAPKAAARFDGAAVDVPTSSASVSLTFAGEDGR